VKDVQRTAVSRWRLRSSDERARIAPVITADTIKLFLTDSALFAGTGLA
jgi:hypothetical protein